MKAHAVVFAIAAVLVLIGIGVIAGSASPRVSTTTFHLPASATYCTFFRFAVVAGGSVTGSFSASPGSVIQYVMTEAQNTAFVAGTGATYVAADTGASGTFTADLPSGGTYYVLSCHDLGYESVDQTGSHTMTVNGLSPDPFWAGIATLVLAIALAGVGMWLRSRPPRPMAPPSPYMAYGPTPPFSGAASPYPAPAVPYPMPVLRTLHVVLENPSGVEESVQLYVNGAPMATIPIPAGGSARMDLHPNAPAPPAVPVRVDAVTRGGSRASQDVVPDAVGEATVSLRIG